MPISLTEGANTATNMTNDNVGISPEILYPGVHTCATVTGVLDSGDLVGAHLANVMTDAKIKQNLKHMKHLAGNNLIKTVYLVGMLSKGWRNPPILCKNSYEWANKQLIVVIREKLKHTGNLFVYDTSNDYKNQTINVAARAVPGTSGAMFTIDQAHAKIGKFASL